MLFKSASDNTKSSAIVSCAIHWAKSGLALVNIRQYSANLPYEDTTAWTGYLNAHRNRRAYFARLAAMSIDDGLVMQLHAGSYRNHSPTVFETFGTDQGFDIPQPTACVNALKPLLDKFGMDTRLSLLLFTLDETRHDVARRVDCTFLADKVAQHIMSEDDARDVAIDLAYSLAKKAYKL